MISYVVHNDFWYVAFDMLKWKYFSFQQIWSYPKQDFATKGFPSRVLPQGFPSKDFTSVIPLLDSLAKISPATISPPRFSIESFIRIPYWDPLLVFSLQDFPHRISPTGFTHPDSPNRIPRQDFPPGSHYPIGFPCTVWKRHWLFLDPLNDT